MYTLSDVLPIPGQMATVTSSKTKPHYYKLLVTLAWNNLHRYLWTFIAEGLTVASRMFLRDVHILPKLFSFQEYCRSFLNPTLSNPNAVCTSEVKPLVVFNNHHRRKRAVLFFSSIQNTPRDMGTYLYIIVLNDIDHLR
jgi:hypothetical protein